MVAARINERWLVRSQRRALARSPDLTGRWLNLPRKKLRGRESTLAGDFRGRDAGFDRARDAHVVRVVGVAHVEILLGGEHDVLERDVGDRAVGDAVDDAGVARAFDGEVTEHDVFDRGTPASSTASPTA